MLKKLINKLFNNPNKIISFRAGYDLTNLPVITLYQGDKKFNFLLDTGAELSAINKEVLSSIEHKVINEKSYLYGIEGTSTIVPMCKISLNYQNQFYEYDYMICDLKKAFDNIKKESGVTLHGVIGSNFFNKYKYVLDFDKLIAYSKI